MKAFLLVLLGAACFAAIMSYSVHHFPQGPGRFIGFAVGTAAFAACAFGAGLARRK